MVSSSHVIIRAYEFCRIECAGLHSGEHLAYLHGYWNASSAAKHFATKAGNSHLQTLQILEGVNLFIEPAKHLRARIAAAHRNQIEGGVDFLP